MFKSTKYLLLLGVAAVLTTQCTKDQEPGAESANAVSISKKSTDNSMSLGAQVAALPAFVDYANQLVIAQQKFKVKLEAQPTYEAREVYVGNLIALLNIGDAPSKLQFVQQIGFNDQLEYDTWMTNTINKLNDLYNDPFFDNLSPEQAQQGVASGLETMPPDFNPPPSDPTNGPLETCLNLKWGDFQVEVDMCYYFHGASLQTMNVGLLDGCLDDAWIHLQEGIEYCHNTYD